MIFWNQTGPWNDRAIAPASNLMSPWILRNDARDMDLKVDEEIPSLLEI